MNASFGVSVRNSIPHSVKLVIKFKLLNIMKELLLDVLRCQREATISRRIIVTTRRLYVRYIAEISTRYGRNIARPKCEIR